MSVSEEAGAPAIRPAGREHLDAVAHVWHRGWMEVHRSHVPVALLAHRKLSDIRMRAAECLNDTYVAVLGAQMVGFIIVHADEVEHLYVAQSARRTGVADMLLAKGEALIAACSDRAWLAVVKENARARHFYERNGWSSAGDFMQPARIANGTILVPALRYEKQLG